jgi:hypothetical protein
MRRKKNIFKDIEKIEVKIHRIRLSGRYYEKDDLEEKLGKLAIFKSQNARMKGYGYIAYRQQKKRKLTFFLKPNEFYMPKCIIETTDPTHKFLFKLKQSLPDLNISQVECTVDIFYPNPQKNRLYFRFLRRNIYFPYQRKITLFADKKKLKECKNNMTLYAGAIKLYERGNDEDKSKGGGWTYDKINRLRMEVTADYAILSKYNLTKLSDFLESLSFEKIFKNRFYFKHFKSARLPGEYEPYRTKDSRGIAGAFYAEHKSAKSIIKNPAQYLKNVKGLGVFKKSIFSNIREFDEKWSKRYVHYEKKYNS